MPNRKRYAIVGTGGRAAMYIEAVCKTYVAHADLVALVDISPTRMAYWNRRIETEFAHAPVRTYAATEFDVMISQARPDVVIVTSMDSTHHTYVIRALELGCDVICEKPLTIDEHKARLILEAVERTGRNVTVTFNLRYTPKATALRDLVRSGRIGTPLTVDLNWTLDTSHGADYFRRWHREKDKSGGLLVHKATHHFDLVNFWIDSSPKTVYAMGDLKFYGRENAKRRGEHYTYSRYTEIAAAKSDPFALDLISEEGLRKLYLEAEKDSGYVRDRNVFGDGITIEDTISVLARYRNGVHLTYSLVAYSPWEGLRACITGTKGRVELFELHGSHIIAGQGDDVLAAQQEAKLPDMPGIGNFLVYYPMFGRPVQLEVPRGEGAHGGGDKVLLEQLFHPNPPADPFGRAANQIDGVRSLLLGCAANRSIETGAPVDVDDLIHPADLKPADFSESPSSVVVAK